MTARHGVRLRTLLRRPGRHGEAIPAEPTTLLQAPAAPAETLAFGEWDTQAAREEAAAIFGPGSHRIDTGETLAAIQAEAHRQAVDAAVAALYAGQADEDTAVWHKPEHLMRDERDETPRRHRPYMDPDPTMIDPHAARWAPPVPAAESASRMARLTYPPADGTREQYAAMARQVSAYTGTRNRTEQPSGWPPVFRAAVQSGPTQMWVQRSPLLALPAGNAGNGVAA